MFVQRMRIFGNILALLVAVAGWYYLFYSKAAVRLSGIEDPALNQRRQRLRRTNGVVMLIMAVLLYAGTDERFTPQVFILIWLGVFLLFFVFVALAVADLRLTARLRRRH
jgi:hypothetical protein